MFKKLFLISFLFIFFKSSYAQADKILNEITQQPDLLNGRWSTFAKNTVTGEILADCNSDKIMYPASNLKLLTTAVALDKLGSDFRIKTFIEYDGKIKSNGELSGNLYIRGEGDPTLGSSEMDGVLPYDSLFLSWVDKLKESGILKISGNIIADDSYFDYMPVPGGWAWEDMGNYYAAGTSGLCVNENLYYLTFTPAQQVGDEAIVLRKEPDIKNLTFINHMKTGKKNSGDNGYIYAAPWQYIHQLEGTIPAGVPEFSIKGAIPDPAKFAAEHFREVCLKNGIAVSGSAITIRESGSVSQGRSILLEHTSPKLKDIVFRLNKKSNNLYTEQLLKILGKKLNGTGSFDSGLTVNKNWLKENGIEIENLFLQDGSGLTRSNGVTTRFFVELLEVMSKKPAFKDYYNSLPVAGDPHDIGGIKTLCTGSSAANNLRAKTGGHNRVRSHSGYVHNQSGQLVCFSMIANDYKGSSKKIDTLHEKLMVYLADLK